MDVGTVVIDNKTEKEYLIISKLINGKFILFENTLDAQYFLEELLDTNSSVINDTEVIFRYPHQLTEI